MVLLLLLVMSCYLSFIVPIHVWIGLLGSVLIIDYIKDNGGTKYWNQELQKVSKLTDKQKRELEGLKNKKLTEKFLEIMESIS